MMQGDTTAIRCGIILAAGEGKRLKPFIHRLRGDDLPKQYVNFIGNRSMLEHTFHRAEKLIPPERLFTVVSQDHLQYPEVWSQLSGRPRGTVILQPRNKETGPGLLLPLMHLYRYYPDAVAVIFPSDHFIMEEDLFMGHVELACRVVEREPSRIVLLGLEPDGPETEYGYILPDRGVRLLHNLVVHQVGAFIEKPGLQAVSELITQGGLWNTMVMAFKPHALLHLAGGIVPTLHRAFHKICSVIGSPFEKRVVQDIYETLDPVNFSKEILQVVSEQYPSRLWVLPVRGVCWSDWGSEQRIVNVLERQGFIGRLHRNHRTMQRTEAGLG